MNTLQMWCGCIGLAAVPVGCLIVFLLNRKLPNDFGSLCCRFPSAGRGRLLAGIAVSLILPASCFFRNWGLFFSCAICFLGNGYAWYMLYVLMSSNKNGLYEYGFILDAVRLQRADIDALSFCVETGVLRLRKTDGTFLEVTVPPSADKTQIASVFAQWNCAPFVLPL